MPLAFIPSPAYGVVNLGPLPIRGYAMSILLGIAVAIWLGDRRWQARGGAKNDMVDIAFWAVPFGIIGGRLYHVITDWQLYFKPGGSGIVGALKIWEGGLGIWGAIALGSVGAWIAARRKGIPMGPLMDALAPGVILAQGIGRWGNWFNQEVFGSPTTLPWGLQIDAVNRPSGYEQFETFHPTFLYEFLWCVLIAILLVWLDRTYPARVSGGRLFAVYVMGYTLGRLLIEMMRIDDANQFFGVRLNVFTSVLVFLGGVILFWFLNRQLGATATDAQLVAARQSENEAASAASSPTTPAASTPKPNPKSHDQVE